MYFSLTEPIWILVLEATFFVSKMHKFSMQAKVFVIYASHLIKNGNSFEISLDPKNRPFCRHFQFKDILVVFIMHLHILHSNLNFIALNKLLYLQETL